MSDGFSSTPSAPSEGWRAWHAKPSPGSNTAAFRWRALETPQGNATMPVMNWSLDGTRLWLAVWADYVDDQHGFAPGGNISLAPSENGLRHMQASVVTSWTDAYFGGAAENCLQIEVPGLEPGEYELHLDMAATCDECAPQYRQVESWTIRFIVGSVRAS